VPVFYVDFVVVDTVGFMQHCLVGPRSHQWGDHVFFSLGYYQKSSLVFWVIAGLLHQLVLQLQGYLPSNLSTGI
jgi:hypothetical protein